VRDEKRAQCRLDHQTLAPRARRISTAGSRVAAWVVPTNEELMLARYTLAVLKASGQ